MTRARTWLVVAPLLLLGTEFAQWVLDRFAPESYKGADPFDEAALGLPLVPLGISIAVVVLGAGLLVHVRAGASPTFPRRVFAVLPLAVFVVQEYVEYALGEGDHLWSVALQWSFAVGLLLQVPFVLLAYLVARLLLGVASAAFGCRSAHVPRVAHAVLRVLPQPALLLASGPARPSGDARFDRGPPGLPSL